MGLVFIKKRLPETKEKSLEEIEFVFAGDKRQQPGDLQKEVKVGIAK
jgi:hypothetical protein